MESEYFMNARVPPSMPTWQSLAHVMEMQTNNESQDCFFNESWDKSTGHVLNSIVSSPAASNSNISSESFMMRELIGKLGSINNNSGMVSPHNQSMLAASYNNSANNSCYSTPLSSPPKLNLPGMDQFSKESLNFPSLGKPRIGLNSSVAEFSADPGFAERAARFSCFGSRSFNGRNSQFGGNNNAELGYRTSPLTGNGKLPRVSSSPSLKAIGSVKIDNHNNNQSSELGNSSQEESSLSVQVANGDNGLKGSNEINSRKRKAAFKSKAKEPTSTPPPNSTSPKDVETLDNFNSKRAKSIESSPVKGDENAKENDDEKQNNKSNSKPPEPPKDYIHVRARRGQATDSHSLAERVRREKISERMKLLQDLVPGCNKVTGKALMLDEIINYVQSLQRQVEFLSMKLASVNTRLDFNMDTTVTKEVFQSNNQLPHQIFTTDFSAAGIFGQQPQQSPALHSNGTLTQCSVDPLDPQPCQNINLHLPSLDPFNHTLPQFPILCEDDLQTIVQMGFGQNLNQEAGLQPPQLFGQNQTNHMKLEL